MERVQQTVEIKLNNEECGKLYKAEKLLEEMKEEIKNINVLLEENDLNDIEECLSKFYKITSRYNVHVTCESLDYIDKICNEIVCSNSECEYCFTDKCKKFLEDKNIEISKNGKCLSFKEDSMYDK